MLFSISQTLKKLLGIGSWGGVKLKLIKRVRQIIYRKKYDAKDVVKVMREMGMKPGSVVCIHSAYSMLFNYTGSAEELISSILKEIGEEGTLVMPAFPKYELANKKGYIFDREKDPTGAGFLAEVFRKWPGVKRSINVRHSVCALGKYAEYLTKDHQYSHDCWDMQSPWYRICELNGFVYTLGMPRSYMGTIIHCTESLLQYESPYWSQFFDKHCVYRYYDNQHRVKTYEEYNSDVKKVVRNNNVFKKLPKEYVNIKMLSGCEIKCLYSKDCLNSFVELAKQGVTIFAQPKYKH